MGRTARAVGRYRARGREHAVRIDGFAEPGLVSVRFVTEAPEPVDSED